MSRILEAREQERAAHTLACKRVPVAKWLGLIPPKWIEDLEQNQQIASCCRHPENHKIEAWYSSDADRDKGIPDIYILICEEQHELEPGVFGEAWHRRFMLGSGKRPFWEVR
jgi:hypothetical protein